MGYLASAAAGVAAFLFVLALVNAITGRGGAFFQTVISLGVFFMLALVAGMWLV